MKYKKQLVSFDIKKIQLASILLFLVPLMFSVVLKIMVFRHTQLIMKVWYVDIIIYIISFFLLVIMHEFVHAVSFLLATKVKWKGIKFGLIPKQGMVYCHCSEPINAKAYAWVIVLPIIITGLIPLVAVIVWGNVFWIIIFSIMVSGGAADIVMLNEVLKLDKKQLVLDHPKAPAFYLLYEEGNLPDDFVEVNEEQEEQLIKNMNISKFNGKKTGVKILLVLIFLALSVVVMGIIGFLLML